MITVPPSWHCRTSLVTVKTMSKPSPCSISTRCAGLMGSVMFSDESNTRSTQGAGGMRRSRNARRAARVTENGGLWRSHCQGHALIITPTVQYAQSASGGASHAALGDENLYARRVTDEVRRARLRLSRGVVLEGDTSTCGQPPEVLRQRARWSDTSGRRIQRLADLDVARPRLSVRNWSRSWHRGGRAVINSSGSRSRTSVRMAESTPMSSAPTRSRKSSSLAGP